MKLGNSIFNLGTSMEGWPARGLIAQIYVQDSDALFNRARSFPRRCNGGCRLKAIRATPRRAVGPTSCPRSA
jgi:hypothetical protein